MYIYHVDILCIYIMYIYHVDILCRYISYMMYYVDCKSTRICRFNFEDWLRYFLLQGFFIIIIIY